VRPKVGKKTRAQAKAYTMSKAATSLQDMRSMDIQELIQETIRQEMNGEIIEQFGKTIDGKEQGWARLKNQVEEAARQHRMQQFRLLDTLDKETKRAELKLVKKRIEVEEEVAKIESGQFAMAEKMREQARQRAEARERERQKERLLVLAELQKAKEEVDDEQVRQKQEKAKRREEVRVRMQEARADMEQERRVTGTKLKVAADVATMAAAIAGAAAAAAIQEAGEAQRLKLKKDVAEEQEKVSAIYLHAERSARQLAEEEADARRREQTERYREMEERIREEAAERGMEVRLDVAKLMETVLEEERDRRER
jgi:hypothetical protein